MARPLHVHYTCWPPNLIPKFPLAGHIGQKDLGLLDEKRIIQNQVGVGLSALDVIVPVCSSG